MSTQGEVDAEAIMLSSNDDELRMTKTSLTKSFLFCLFASKQGASVEEQSNFIGTNIDNTDFVDIDSKSKDKARSSFPRSKDPSKKLILGGPQPTDMMIGMSKAQQNLPYWPTTKEGSSGPTSSARLEKELNRIPSSKEDGFWCRFFADKY